jgi:hypothetical protein
MEPATPKENGNGKAGVIASLLGDKDPMVKIITLGLVVFTGVGNFWATQRSEHRNIEEVDRALKEIHYIRSLIDDFEKRQVDMSNRIKAIDEHTVEIQEHIEKTSP